MQVDLPHPEDPTRAMCWPAFRFMLKSLRTVTVGLVGYLKLALLNSAFPCTWGSLSPADELESIWGFLFKIWLTLAAARIPFW